MFLSVKEMELRKVRFDETFRPGELDFSETSVRQGGPLHAKGVAELLPNTGGEIRVRGDLDVNLETDCDRCLGPAAIHLNANMDLFYRPMSDIASDEEIAIDEGEAEIAFYEGGGMKLEDILREQILLLLPMQRVCRQDCRGICPVCGSNRNERLCDCRQPAGDDRWLSLRKLTTS